MRLLKFFVLLVPCFAICALWLTFSGSDSVASNHAGEPARSAAERSRNDSPSDASRSTAEHAPLERRIFESVNQERVRRGLKPLEAEPTLIETARAHSRDMQERGFFSHGNPDGASAADRIAWTHRRLIGTTGENIWRGSGATPSGDELASWIMESWMNSTGHRDNILHPEFTHLGVGVHRSGDGIWATQNFAGVAAYLNRPLPPSVRPGDALDLMLTSYLPGEAPTRFDALSRSDRRAVGPLSSGASLDASGEFQIRAYFPQPGSTPNSTRYTIISGPFVRVE